MPSGSNQQSACMPYLAVREGCYTLSSDYEEQQTQIGTDSLLDIPSNRLMMPSVPLSPKAQSPNNRPNQDPMTANEQHQQPTREHFWPSPPTEPEDTSMQAPYQQQLSTSNEQQIYPQQEQQLHHPSHRQDVPDRPRIWTQLHDEAELAPSVEMQPPQPNYQQQQQQYQASQKDSGYQLYTPVSGHSLALSDIDGGSPCISHLTSGYFNTPVSDDEHSYPSPGLASEALTEGTIPLTPPPIAVNCLAVVQSKASKLMDLGNPGPRRERPNSSRSKSVRTAATLANRSSSPLGRTATGASRPSAKTSEPYAKLIERALLSRPDHTMSLQEIYQWFYDNTDKAGVAGKGWQNSIRHNLSMNAAFSKNEINASEDLSSCSDPKRSTEWVLAEWAVKNGVQSTTRYRKTNVSRRASSLRLRSHPYNLQLRSTPHDSAGFGCDVSPAGYQALRGSTYGHAAGLSPSFGSPQQQQQQRHHFAESEAERNAVQQSSSMLMSGGTNDFYSIENNYQHALPSELSRGMLTPEYTHPQHQASSYRYFLEDHQHSGVGPGSAHTMDTLGFPTQQATVTSTPMYYVPPHPNPPAPPPPTLATAPTAVSQVGDYGYGLSPADLAYSCDEPYTAAR